MCDLANKSHLRASSVVVQTGEAGEVLFRDRRSRFGGNQAVGVGRVPHDQDLKDTQHTLQNELNNCNL